MISLKALKAKVAKQRNTVISALRRIKRDDPFATQDRSIIVEPGTDAAQLFGHEQTVILEQKLKKDLKEIEMALSKIKKRTYGVCERCSLKIEFRRLEAKPTAIYCLKCEREIEKES